MTYGLLGRVLKHSYSPQIHKMLGNPAYVLFEKEPEEIAHFLKCAPFTGINVTIPYKKTVIEYLDELSPAAKKLGAVNTIIRRNDGSLYGHNTDYFGFRSMVKHSGVTVCEKKILVLGSGGASVTCEAVLNELGADVVIISRTGENNYDNLHYHSDAAVIVNTTPVGMYPDTSAVPVDLDQFPNLEGVLDLIYNPGHTRLLQEAEKRSLKWENGLWMLVAQAKEAAELFMNCSIPDTQLQNIHASLSQQMQNIILIGMPGCGKSTIGKLLAERTGHTFVDADSVIAELAGMDIPSIFFQNGEDTFRRFETEALRKLGKESGLLIATGGGCVTRAENYPLLHQNGKIIWLQRDLDVLPKEGRPLSLKNDLRNIYAIRKPMYEAFADFSVDNNASQEETIALILKYLEDLA